MAGYGEPEGHLAYASRRIRRWYRRSRAVQPAGAASALDLREHSRMLTE